MVNNFEAKEAVDKLIRYCTEHDCKTECAIRERCVEMKDKSYLFHLGPHKSPEEKTHAKDYIERMKDEEHKLLEKWDKLNSFRYRHCDQLDETELYLMGEQVKVIDKYIRILDARIAHAIVKDKTQEEI